MRFSKVLAAGLVITMLIGMVPFSQDAEGAPVSDYPGRFKQIDDFESVFSDITTYGNWVMTPPDTVWPGAFLWTRTYGQPHLEGSFAEQLQFRVIQPGGLSAVFVYDHFHYEFTSSVSDLYQIHTPSFHFRGNATEGVQAAVQYWTTDALGVVLTPVYQDTLTLDDAWHLQTCDNLFVPSGTTYHIAIEFGTFVYDLPHIYGSGWGNLTLDNMYSDSPSCSVRFSFYNYYTGLGLMSELLIPEVWHDGTWIRVWDNEVKIAAGELISYRVSDYFGQVIVWQPSLVLNDTILYLDIPIKLIKVNIAKPEWWTSSLPPEWQITYLPSGVQVAITGWEVELIAGWYQFSWVNQAVTNKVSSPADSHDELIIENGSTEQYIDGDLTTARAYTMSDFFLSLEPTYSGTMTSGTVIQPDLTQWDGIYAAFSQFLDQFQNSVEFKLLIVVGCLFTVWGLIVWIRRRAREFKSGEKQPPGGSE